MHKLYQQIYNATRYSVDGMSYLLRSEFAARIEVYGLIFTALLFFILDVSVATYGIGIILFLLMISAEALNTAIEVVIDRVSPEISATGKRAKDLGSFAVLCVSLANLVFIAYVVACADYTDIIYKTFNRLYIISPLIVIVAICFYTIKRIGKQPVAEE